MRQPRIGGNIASIFRMIEIELAIVASITGQGLSYCASFRAASIDAAIKSTRFLLWEYNEFAFCLPRES
jgi:hypothetical protein